MALFAPHIDDTSMNNPASALTAIEPLRASDYPASRSDISKVP